MGGTNAAFPHPPRPRKGKKDNPLRSVSYQFILSRKFTPQAIISHFDIDYIQIAIDKHCIYRTTVQKQAQKTHIVSRVLSDIRMRRLDKVYQKGYAFPADILAFRHILLGRFKYYDGEWESRYKDVVTIKEIRGRVDRKPKLRYWPYQEKLESRRFIITNDSNDLPLDSLIGSTRKSYEGENVEVNLEMRLTREKENTPSLVDIHTLSHILLEPVFPSVIRRMPKFG